jgi:hypothetical protein
MTGVYKGEKYSQAAVRLGVRHYLEKPFSRESFEAALHDTLRSIEASWAKPTLLATLISIYNNRESGLLTINDFSPIAFSKGEPSSFLTRGKPDFAGFLRAKGKISDEDVGSFIDSNGDRLFFTEAGILTFDDLQHESQLYLVKLLIDNLQKSAGICFSPEAGRDEPPLLHLSIPRLLYDAARHYPEQLQSQDSVTRQSGLFPARTTLFYRRANLIAMSEADISLLEKVNGERTVAELVGSDKNTPSSTAFLNFLHLMGMISLRETAGPEATPDFPLKTLFNRPLEESNQLEELLIDFDDIVEEVADNVVMAMGSSGMATPLSEAEIDFEQSVQREYALIKDKNYYALFDMKPVMFSFNTLKEAYFGRL